MAFISYRTYRNSAGSIKPRLISIFIKLNLKHFITAQTIDDFKCQLNARLIQISSTDGLYKTGLILKDHNFAPYDSSNYKIKIDAHTCAIHKSTCHCISYKPGSLTANVSSSIKAHFTSICEHKQLDTWLKGFCSTLISVHHIRLHASLCIISPFATRCNRIYELSKV